MSNTPIQPGFIEPNQLNAITQAMSGLDSQQLTWLSGYTAGLAAAGRCSRRASYSSPNIFCAINYFIRLTNG
jgi:hypothetical protein